MFRGRHQESAERRISSRIRDKRPRSTVPVGCRGHPQSRPGILIEPALRRISRASKRADHGLPSRQTRSQLAQPALFQIPSRRNAHHFGEDALEMEGAQAESLPQASKRDSRGRVLPDVIADALHQVRFSGYVSCFRRDPLQVIIPYVSWFGNKPFCRNLADEGSLPMSRAL